MKHLSNFHTLQRKQIADGMGSVYDESQRECIYGIHRKLFHSDSLLIVSESRFVMRFCDMCNSVEQTTTAAIDYGEMS